MMNYLSFNSQSKLNQDDLLIHILWNHTYIGFEEVGFEKMKKCLTCKYSITIIIILRNNIFRLSASFRVCSGTGYEKRRLLFSRVLRQNIFYIETLNLAYNSCNFLDCNGILFKYIDNDGNTYTYIVTYITSPLQES